MSVPSRHSRPGGRAQGRTVTSTPGAAGAGGRPGGAWWVPADPRRTDPTLQEALVITLEQARLLRADALRRPARSLPASSTRSTPTARTASPPSPRSTPGCSGPRPASCRCRPPRCTATTWSCRTTRTSCTRPPPWTWGPRLSRRRRSASTGTTASSLAPRLGTAPPPRRARARPRRRSGTGPARSRPAPERPSRPGRTRRRAAPAGRRAQPERPPTGGPRDRCRAVAPLPRRCSARRGPGRSLTGPRGSIAGRAGGGDRLGEHRSAGRPSASAAAATSSHSALLLTTSPSSRAGFTRTAAAAP